jgi:hypothetical protein
MARTASRRNKSIIFHIDLSVAFQLWQDMSQVEVGQIIYIVVNRNALK